MSDLGAHARTERTRLRADDDCRVMPYWGPRRLTGPRIHTDEGPTDSSTIQMLSINLIQITAHRDNSTSRLAKSSSGPARRLKWWFQGLSYTLNSFLLSIFTNHRYFSLWLSIIAFPFQASIHINTKSARFKGRTYLADDPICIHLHNNN